MCSRAFVRRWFACGVSHGPTRDVGGVFGIVGWASFPIDTAWDEQGGGVCEQRQHQFFSCHPCVTRQTHFLFLSTSPPPPQEIPNAATTEGVCQPYCSCSQGPVLLKRMHDPAGGSTLYAVFWGRECGATAAGTVKTCEPRDRVPTACRGDTSVPRLSRRIGRQLQLQLTDSFARGGVSIATTENTFNNFSQQKNLYARHTLNHCNSVIVVYKPTYIVATYVFAVSAAGTFSQSPLRQSTHVQVGSNGGGSWENETQMPNASDI